MVATLLRCILCLGDPSQINVSTIWSIRETVSLMTSCDKSTKAKLKKFVGIIAVNLPVLKPFLSQAKQAISSGSSKKQSGASGNALTGSFRLSHVDPSGKKRTVHDISMMDDSSEENMIKQHKIATESQTDLTRNSAGLLSLSGSMKEEDGIQVTQRYEVSYSSHHGNV